MGENCCKLAGNNWLEWLNNAENGCKLQGITGKAGNGLKLLEIAVLLDIAEMT